MSEILRIENISKSFGSQKVLDNISLSINAGEIFSMLGPSGCGKSTLLRICGGFEEPDEGRIILDGVDITGVPPHKRGIHTVFQSYALFPNMTVWDNIAFPLKIAKAEKKYIRQEVEKYLDMIQMSEHADKKPRELSEFFRTDAQMSVFALLHLFVVEDFQRRESVDFQDAVVAVYVADCPLEEIGVSDECGDETVFRRFVNFGRRSLLFHDALVHDGDMVADFRARWRM